MSEEKVLTEMEIKNINNVRDDFQILIGQIGEIEVGIIDLNKRKEKLIESLDKIQEKEKQIAKELETKYGKGNISLETGEFTPIE